MRSLKHKNLTILPSTFKFPSKIEYGKHRSFNPQWVNEYAWYHTHLFKMEYIISIVPFFLIQQLTGLTLMNFHCDMSLDTEGIINTFTIKHPRRMKFKNTLEDVK